MADHAVKVGVMISCDKGEGESDDSMPTISVFKGAAVIGRDNLPFVDKRVSRKHISLVGKDDGTFEVGVEGPNPIVIQTGLERKKFDSHEKAQLLHGDILELLPGCWAYKYKSLADEKGACSRNGEILVETTSSLKRKHQVVEDEAYARTLQEEIWSGSISVTNQFGSSSTANAHGSSYSLEPMRRFNVSNENLPLTFRLLRVQGIPAWANTSSVSIDDVIEGNVLVAVLSNYMVDIDWLIPACPLLKTISHVLVVHGEKGASLEHMKLPDLRINCPPFGNVTVSASFFKRFDYRSSKVRLIASVPGYHSGSNLKKWGHMKMRDVLHSCCFDKAFQNSPLLYQFSSLGSLDEKWMDEFACSLSSGMSDDKLPLGLGKAQIVWPTVEDIRCSLEGYAAGNAVPSPLKNVEKLFLKKYWARWQADHSGRGWFLLSSANLSKAAWGALQKNNSQLMIRSYELGVLFLPTQSVFPDSGFSCTKPIGTSQKKQAGTNTRITELVTLCWQGNNGDCSEVVKIPIPYQIPPRPYSPEDIPWSWDRRYFKKDVFGQVWPRQVQIYIDENT